MGPDELDDLLASIRAESKKDSALSLYKGTKSTDLVSEQIDERILNLLGLDDVFDIDYATYISLLRERVAAGRMKKQKIPTEEVELVTNEFKRVKGKVGRFKVKKKKITAANIAVSKPIGAVNQKALMPSGGIGEEFVPAFNDINTKLDELLAAVKADFKAEEEREKQDRQREENQRRRAREKKMEAKESPIIKSLKKTAKKIVSPFQAILDRIFRFIGFTLLGYGVDKFFKWFSDPANKKKIETVGRFLKDWWPTLLGAAALFFTPLGKLVRGTMKLLKMFTPSLIRLAAANPITAGLLAAGGTTLILALLNQGQVEKQREIVGGVTPKPGAKPNITQLYTEGSRGMFQFSNGGIVPKTTTSVASPIILKNSSPSFNNGGIIPRTSTIPVNAFDGGGLQTMNVGRLGFSGGGAITRDTGLDITGAGPDTQLIAAKPGEIVLPTETVNKYGSKFFMDLIRASGKSGNPRFVNNIQFARDGGMVGGNIMQSFANQRSSISSNNQGINQTQYRFLGMPIPFLQNAERMASSSPGRMTLPRVSTAPRYSSNDSLQRIRTPQSQMKPVGTPVITTETKVIVLPPKTTVAKKPDYTVKSGTDIPDFSPIAAVAHRMKVTEALGISNLV